MLDKEELAYVKAHLDFWDKLNEEQRMLLEKQTMKISYKRGYHLYSTASECLGVMLIQTGGVRVYLLSEDGREVTLYCLGDGEVCVLSASCVFNNAALNVHIDVERDMEAYLIPAAVFAKLKNQNIYVENFINRDVVERFSDVMWMVEQILFMSLEKRLAIFLVDEMARTHSEELRLTQEQVARYIGSAREVVSRTLKTFQGEGLIEQSRGIIRVKDRKRLMDLVI